MKFIAVNVDRNSAKPRRFMERLKLKMPVAYDSQNKALAQYDVAAMPLLYIVDGKGTVKSRGRLSKRDIHPAKKRIGGDAMSAETTPTRRATSRQFTPPSWVFVGLLIVSVFALGVSGLMTWHHEVQAYGNACRAGPLQCRQGG